MTVLSYRLEDILKKRRNRWAGPHADRDRDSKREKEAREAKAKEEAEKKKKKLTDFPSIPEKTPKQRKREVRDDRQRITEREDAASQQSVPVNYTVRDDKLGQLDESGRTFSDEQKKEEETQQKIRDANAAAKKKLAEDAANEKKYGVNLDNFKRFLANQEEKKTKKKKRRLGSKEGQEDEKTWSKEDLDSLDLGTSKETTFADSEEAKDDKVDKADKKEVKLTEGGKKVLDEAKRYASLNMYKSWLEARKAEDDEEPPSTVTSWHTEDDEKSIKRRKEVEAKRDGWHTFNKVPYKGKRPSVNSPEFGNWYKEMKDKDRATRNAINEMKKLLNPKKKKPCALCGKSWIRKAIKGACPWCKDKPKETQDLTDETVGQMLDNAAQKGPEHLSNYVRSLAEYQLEHDKNTEHFHKKWLESWDKAGEKLHPGKKINETDSKQDEALKDVSGAMGGTRGLGHDGGSKQSPGSSAQITEVIDQKLDDGEALNAEIKRGVKTSVNNIEGASTKAAYENHEQDEGTDVKPNSQQINPARPKVDALKAKHLYKKALVVKYNNIYKPLNI